MEHRLVPLNAWIALMTGEGDWPAPLRDSGFRLLGLEQPVTTSEGPVVVDGLGNDARRRVLLATEAKSGQNVDQAQARSYGAMTAADVARQVTAAREADAVQPAYVCLEGSEGRIRSGLDAAGVDAPIIVVGTARARVIHASGGGAIGLWDVGLPGGPPPRLIPVDAESPEEQFRDLVLPALIAAARRNLSQISIAELTDQVVPYSQRMGRATRNRIGRKVAAAARSLARGEFRDTFSVEPGGSEIDGDVVRILRSPAGYAPQGETQGWQALQRKGQRALRGRVTQVAEGQLSLEDLGLSISEPEA